ncbi:MAG: SCO family protein [Chloroflexi bacterium]|nr:SCO family protein [Chloroflexota bacterium]
MNTSIRWQTSEFLPTPLRYGAAVVVGLLALSIIAFAIFQPIKVLPRIGLAPGLGLIDQDGRVLSNETLRGHIVLYNFTYSRCASPCPQTMGVMQAVQEQLNGSFDNKGFRIRLLTISLDPAYDTPQVLKEFALRSGADRPRWWFVTGDESQLKYAVGGGFNVYYAADAKGGITVDPVFVLVDGWGIVRAEYRTASPAIDRILRDISLVIDEAKNSEGVARYAYEAAHLFLCYPK